MKYLVPLMMGAALAAADIVPPFALSEADVMGKTLTFTDGSSLTFYRSMTAKRVDPTNGTSYGTWSIENGSMVVDQQIDMGGGLYMTMAGSAYMDAAPAAGVVDRFFANGKRDDAVIDTIVDNGTPIIHPVTYTDISAYDINVTNSVGDTITLEFQYDMTLFRGTNGTRDGYGTWSIENGVVMMTTKGVSGVEVATAMFDAAPADGVDVNVTFATGNGGDPVSFSSPITYKANGSSGLAPTFPIPETDLAGQFINFSNLSNKDCNVSFFSNMALKQVCDDGSVEYGSWSVEEDYLRIDSTNYDGALPVIVSRSILMTQPLANGGQYWSLSTDDNLTQGTGTASVIAPLTEDYIIKVHSDFDGDGHPDLVWRNGTLGKTAIWRLNGTNFVEAIALPTASNPDWDVKGVGDFDGDGQQDLVWRNGTLGKTAIWRLNGTDFVEAIALPTASNPDWDVKGVGDFDGDGQQDLVWRNGTLGKTAIWRLNGTSFIEAIELPTASNPDWDVKGVGDFDGDGNPDLVWRNGTLGRTAIWRLNGTSFIEAIELPTASNPDWDVKGVGDFDGDGQQDLIWRNGTLGKTAIWRLNGTSFIEAIELPTASNPDWDVKNR